MKEKLLYQITNSYERISLNNCDCRRVDVCLQRILRHGCRSTRPKDPEHGNLWPDSVFDGDGNENWPDSVFNGDDNEEFQDGSGPVLVTPDATGTRPSSIQLMGIARLSAVRRFVKSCASKCDILV
jgi:hypothetical protein